MCVVCNQSRSCLEDQINKPWRPIPSGRVTERQAGYLVVVLYICCISVSTYFGVARASIVLCCLTLSYDRLHGNKHWISKNLLTAGGYACFEFGSTSLAGKVPSMIWLKYTHNLYRAAGTSEIDDLGYAALIFSASVVFTTVHAQDFEVCQNSESFL